MTALALAGLLITLAGCSTDGADPPKATALSGGGPPSGDAIVEATIEVGADPIGIAAGEGSLWVVNAEINAERGSVSRVDPESGEVLATVGVGAVPLEVAVGEGSVWVSNSGDDTVSRINPSSNEAVAAIDVCAAPEGLAIGAGSVWVVCEDDGVVARIDPTTDEMVDQIDVGLQPRFVAFAFGGVWVSSYFDGTISRIDPDTGKVEAEIVTAQGPQIMLEAAGSLWVSCTDADVVQRIDPITDEVVAEVGTPVAPDGLAFDGEIVWVATELGPELVGVDVIDNAILVSGTVADHGSINANQVMAFESGSLWLPILDDGVVLEVPPLASIVEWRRRLCDRAERHPAPAAVRDLHGEGLAFGRGLQHPDRERLVERRETVRAGGGVVAQECLGAAHLRGELRQLGFALDAWLFRAGRVAREQLYHRLADTVQVRTEFLQDLRRDAFVFADQAEQEVLGPDVVVTELERLPQRELEDLLRSRGEWDVSWRRLPTLADDLLDASSRRSERDA